MQCSHNWKTQDGLVEVRTSAQSCRASNSSPAHVFCVDVSAATDQQTAYGYMSIVSSPYQGRRLSPVRTGVSSYLRYHGRCKKMSEYSSFALTSAPQRTNTWHMSMCPAKADSIKAVRCSLLQQASAGIIEGERRSEYLSFASTSAPQRIKKRQVSKCPFSADIIKAVR